MRTSISSPTLNSLETLEVKLSPTTLSGSGIVATSMISTVSATPADDDPPPVPEPAPPPYPGDDPPIIYPLSPPSGPAGPG